MLFRSQFSPLSGENWLCRSFRQSSGHTHRGLRLRQFQPCYHGLSVIENPKRHGKSYNKWLGDKAEPTRRDVLRAAVDAAMEGQNIKWSRYCSYGIGLVRFAKEEKQLFRFLYLDDGQNGNRQDDIHIPQIIRVIQEDYGYSEEIARQFHRDMSRLKKLCLFPLLWIWNG